jgi:hypothetical protein
MKIDPRRLVLPLSMLLVLIYFISLPIEPSVEMNIHNQCLNIDLVSAKYFTSYMSKYYRTPDYEVCAGDKTRFGFIIGSNYMISGALIYRLQRKQAHESNKIDKDTSSISHLSVLWDNLGSERLYADVLLVEYDKKFDQVDLMNLNIVNSVRIKQSPDTTTRTWLLDDDVALMIISEITNEGRLLNITVSEVVRHHSARMPVQINQKK